MVYRFGWRTLQHFNIRHLSSPDKMGVLVFLIQKECVLAGVDAVLFLPSDEATAGVAEDNVNAFGRVKARRFPSLNNPSLKGWGY